MHLLVNWGHVFIWRADFQGLVELVENHLNITESSDEKGQVGIFYANFGFALGYTSRFKESYKYLLKALSLSEEAGNETYIGYSCARLVLTCFELGLFDDAVAFGKRGMKIAEQLEWDPPLIAETFCFASIIYSWKGDLREAETVANTLIEKGKMHFDDQVSSWGYWALGLARLHGGDSNMAIEKCKQTMKLTKVPIVYHLSQLIIGVSFLYLERMQDAEKVCEDFLEQTKSIGKWAMRKWVELFLAPVRSSNGFFSQGLQILTDHQRYYFEKGWKIRYAFAEHMLGIFYLRMIQRNVPIGLSLIVRNFTFLVKTLPLARKKSENHFNKAIVAAKEIGAKGILGQSYLQLGRLHELTKRNEKAEKCFSESISLFEQCGAAAFLKQARETLESLNS